MTHVYELRGTRTAWSVWQSVWSAVILPALRSGARVHLTVEYER